MPKQHRVFYDTIYTRNCSKLVWPEQPEGLIRAHLGKVEVTSSGTLVVPVVAIYRTKGKGTIKKTHNVYIPAATAKKLSPRLRRVSVKEEAPA